MKVHEFMYEMRSTASTFGRKHDIQVQFEGDQAYTDGKVINLPALPTSGNLNNAQVRAMRGYVDHEAGHIRHSDMPRVIEFYDRCKNNDKAALRDIHNCLEDHWMEAKVMDEYTGTRKNLWQLNELIASTNADEWGKDTDWGTFNHGSVCSGISSVGYEGNSGDNMKKLIDQVPEEFQDHVRGWVEHAIKCENSEEVITLAKSVYKLLEEDPEMQQSPEDFDPQAGEDMDEGDNSEEYKKAQAKGEGQEGNPFDSNQGQGKEGEGEGEPQWVKADNTEALNSAEQGDGASGAIGGNNGDLKGAYKVWSTKNDVEYKRGTNKSDQGLEELHEIVNSSDHSKYDTKKAEINGNINTMKNKLKRSLLAKKQRDWDPGREVGRLDSKRLVSAYTGSRTVFKQRIDREEEDTAVTILVDLSGSMYGRKADVANDCVVALSECLAGSDITFNVVGFCNRRYDYDVPYGYHRPEPLDTVFFKDFDTPLRIARSSIGQITEAVGGNNSDYDFIVNAVNALTKRQEQRKVLFVLSDGSPANAGDASTSELIRHCKIATQDAKKKGVECIGIGICDSSVTRIYSDNVVVNNVNDLSSAVFNKLTKLLVDGGK